MYNEEEIIKILENYFCDRNEQFDEIVREFYALKKEFELKERIIETLNKVIFSQEQEILELKKEKHLQEKRRAWHY